MLGFKIVGDEEWAMRGRVIDGYRRQVADFEAKLKLAAAERRSLEAANALLQREVDLVVGEQNRAAKVSHKLNEEIIRLYAEVEKQRLEADLIRSEAGLLRTANANGAAEYEKLKAGRDKLKEQIDRIGDVLFGE